MISFRFSRSARAAFAGVIAACLRRLSREGADPGTAGRQCGWLSEQPRSARVDDGRQLSRRAARQRRTRRRFGGRVLSLGAAMPIRRTVNCSTARSCPSLVDGDIDEAVQTRRPCPADRQDQPRRPPGARRARYQAEEIPVCAAESRAVGPRPDHRPHRDTAACVGELWRRRFARPPSRRSTSLPDRTGIAIFKDLHAGMILELAGNQKDAGSALRARLQAGRIGAARRRGLWRAGCRATRTTPRRWRYLEAFDKVLPRHPLIVEGDGRSSRPARSCRRWCGLAAGRRG